MNPPSDDTSLVSQQPQIKLDFSAIKKSDGQTYEFVLDSNTYTNKNIDNDSSNSKNEEEINEGEDDMNLEEIENTYFEDAIIDNEEGGRSSLK